MVGEGLRRGHGWGAATEYQAHGALTAPRQGADPVVQGQEMTPFGPNTSRRTKKAGWACGTVGLRRGGSPADSLLQVITIFAVLRKFFRFQELGGIFDEVLEDLGQRLIVRIH